MMASLFPDDAKGKQFYLKYNDPKNPTLHLKEFLDEKKYTEQQLTNAGIASFITMIGNEWNNNKNTKAAIKVFEYGLLLMPTNTNLYDNLGELYFELAKKTFKKSLLIVTKNKKAQQFLEKIETISNKE
jgi:hypothetical protein